MEATQAKLSRHTLVFMDAEYTGEHMATTLVSVALVAEDGKELKVNFSDYAQDQVTPWLQENVLSHLEAEDKFNQYEGLQMIKNWLESVRQDRPVALVSAGKYLDMGAFFQLWHKDFPERKYFHGLYCLPDCLNHGVHFDLSTMFMLAGINPGIDRDDYANIQGRRHDSLHDARVVKACFDRLIKEEKYLSLPDWMRSLVLQ